MNIIISTIIALIIILWVSTLTYFEFIPKNEVYVSHMNLDLSSFGVNKNIQLNGDYNNDIKSITELSDSMNKNKSIALDSNGLPYDENQFRDVIIIANDSADLYSIFMADLFSMFYFCNGSRIVLSDLDTLYSPCHFGQSNQDKMHNGYKWYNTEIIVGLKNRFCVHKSSGLLKVKIENICFDDMDYFNECGFELQKQNLNNYELEEIYNTCKSKAASVNDSFVYYNAGFIVTGDEVDAYRAISEMNRIKNKLLVQINQLENSRRMFNMQTIRIQLSRKKAPNNR
jgi:hypothetical protein